MSSGNKSSSKLIADSSTTGVQDDDCFTWLQYPTDDALERSYCSDLFQGGWPLATAAEGRLAVQSNINANSAELEGTVSNSEGQSFCQTGCQPGLSVVWKQMGSKTPLNSRPSSKLDAEEALAQGAARAAGYSWPVHQDSLNRVRTLLRPTDVHPPLATLRDSIHTCNQFTDCTLQPNLPVSSVPASAPNALQNAKSMKVNMLGSSPSNKIKHAAAESTGFSSKRSRTDFEPYSNLYQTESSRITEVSTPRWGKEVIDNHQKRTWIAASSSGASQTSMSLSGRETSFSEKFKQEDSELLFEDFTEDDFMDTKKRSKIPSKRNRVPEVHNLSERIRRNKINEKLKALQDLVPNSSKIDKASVLDEAIEYMKTLQTQLQMVSMRNGLNVSAMMTPMSLPQTHLALAQPPSIGIGVPVSHAGMGISLGIMPETGHPLATGLFPCPTAMMSQMHAMPFHGQNMGAFGHLGFAQNLQISPNLGNIQERRTATNQQQVHDGGWSLLQHHNFENDTLSVEQDDFSD